MHKLTMRHLWSAWISALTCWLRSTAECDPASPWHFRPSSHIVPCSHPSDQNWDFAQVPRSISSACCRWETYAESLGRNSPLPQAACTMESLSHILPFLCLRSGTLVGFALELNWTDAGGDLRVWIVHRHSGFVFCYLLPVCLVNSGGGSW